MKSFARFLTTALLFSILFPASAFAANSLYTDFETTQTINHFEAIYQLTNEGLISGYEDGTFDMEGEINRAEMAKLLVLSTGITEDELTTTIEEYVEVNGSDSASFTDVDVTLSPEDVWYANYVAYMKIQGWASGYTDGSYRPADPVTIAEALKLVVESQWGTPSRYYAGEQWYELYVNMLDHFNIVYGEYSSIYENDLPSIFFGEGDVLNHPDQPIERADFVELLYRVRNSLEKGNGSFTTYSRYITVNKYEDLYEATFIENGDGTFSMYDPHFGFSLENVALGDFELDDLLVYIVNPSGFSNGYETYISFLYPSETEGYTSLFYITVRDEDHYYDSNLYLYLTSNFSQEGLIYFIDCGFEHVDDLQIVRDSICANSSSWEEDPFEATFEAYPIAGLYDKFAQCLTDTGFTLYGAYWCPHCTTQADLFGDSFAFIDYVECAEGGENADPDRCDAANITAYPTWIDAAGAAYMGVQELATLAELSACELPSA